MLPNFKTQSAILKKFFARIGIDLATHEAIELVARMHGFSDYQALLRGVDKLAYQLFDGKVMHVVATSNYISGEDEVCYLLRQILNLKGFKQFAIEARGYCRPEPVRDSSAGTGGGLDHFLVKRDELQNPSFGGFYCPSNELIAASEVFSEVLLVDGRREGQVKERLVALIENYLKSQPFQAGIVSTGETSAWKLLDFVSSHTEFTPAYHLAISRTYKNGDSPERVVRFLDEIAGRTRGSVAVAWIFEDDCASGSDGRTRNREIFPSEMRDHELLRGNTLIPGLGCVDSTRERFFSPIMAALERLKIPFIRVPHYTGHRCFVAERVSPEMVGERDRVTAEIIAQMQALGMSR